MKKTTLLYPLSNADLLEVQVVPVGGVADQPVNAGHRDVVDMQDTALDTNNIIKYNDDNVSKLGKA